MYLTIHTFDSTHKSTGYTYIHVRVATGYVFKLSEIISVLLLLRLLQVRVCMSTWRRWQHNAPCQHTAHEL